MNPKDIANLIANAEAQLARLVAIVKWKGNWAPDPKHFSQDSIKVSGGVLASEGKLWLAFDFTDDTGAHQVKAVGPWDKFGAPGGAETITLDGQDVDADDLVIAPVEGMEGLFNFYARLKVEFRFDLNGVKHDLRFDGPV